MLTKFRIGAIGKTLAKAQAAVLAVVLIASTFPMSARAIDGAQPNPALASTCGFDIALVMDTSGSIDNGELADMKDAFHGFVNLLLPGTPTAFSLVSFDDTAVTQQGFTSTASVINDAIDATDGSGATNWEAGLLEAEAQFDYRASAQNIVIFASDGNPTINNGSDATPSDTDGNDLTNAVTVANNIKASGARIITIGIGNDVDADNLKAISSSDAYYDSDFSTLNTALTDIATELCGGKLNVAKVIDEDGDLGTEDDQSPAFEWEFVVGDDSYYTDESGSVSIDVAAGTYDVTEVQQDGYTFLDAVCTVGHGVNGLTATGVDVDDQTIVSCTFYNQPPADLPVCSDGQDNDGDDFADYPNDPGCDSPEDNNETDEGGSCEPGFHLEGESCVPNDPTCPEGQVWDGEQCSVPSEGGDTDVCKNIEGVQLQIPNGMKVQGDGECVTNKGRRGGGGHRRSSGEVLGEATCAPLLTQYLHIGWANDAAEVTKLQTFLNEHLGLTLPTNGFFGNDTFEAVKQFQIKYGSAVLNPWVGFPASGITGPSTPTGFVYQTTRWQINNIWCPGSEAFPSSLI